MTNRLDVHFRDRTGSGSPTTLRHWFFFFFFSPPPEGNHSSSAAPISSPIEVPRVRLHQSPILSSGICEVPRTPPVTKQAAQSMPCRGITDVFWSSRKRTPEVHAAPHLRRGRERGTWSSPTHAFVATLAEALTRICMFISAAESRAGIRAQLAGFALSVVRLPSIPGESCPGISVVGFPVSNPAADRRPPRALFAAGPISARSANVLPDWRQAGMWNFDLYQRWVAQKKMGASPTHGAAPCRRSGLLPSPPQGSNAQPHRPPARASTRLPWKLRSTRKWIFDEMAKRIRAADHLGRLSSIFGRDDAHPPG